MGLFENIKKREEPFFTAVRYSFAVFQGKFGYVGEVYLGYVRFFKEIVWENREKIKYIFR